MSVMQKKRLADRGIRQSEIAQGQNCIRLNLLRVPWKSNCVKKETFCGTAVLSKP
jgi:hypothetical protein